MVCFFCFLFPFEYREMYRLFIIHYAGALTAVEQDDLDSLRAILSKKSFPRSTLDDLLENGLYANFSPKFTLLDIALALDRRRVAEHLLKNAARGNPECMLWHCDDLSFDDLKFQEKKRFLKNRCF
jgi:hypothetical protein